MSHRAEPEVVIGLIVGAFGTRGETKVRLETDFPERLPNRTVWLKPPDGPPRQSRIESVRFHKGNALVKFEGVDDMTAAQALRGFEVRVPRSELAELPEGEFYVHDIVGLQAVTEAGEDLGVVTEVIRGPANDVYVTARAMIPALKEVVVSIDLEAGKMIVRPIGGMLEE